MLRNRFLPFALGAVALSSISFAGLRYAEVQAQGAPPELNMVLYGDAPAGTVAGQPITAVVVHNGKSTNCGTANIINDGGLKFVIRVKHESAVTGCGATGRNVTLYFGPANGQPGRLSQNAITWQRGPKQATVTLGNALPVRGIAPFVASDGRAR